MNRKYTDDKLWRFTWKGGKAETGYGRDSADAFTRLGYGNGAIAALDYFERVNEPTPVAPPVRDMRRWMAHFVTITKPDGTKLFTESEPHYIILDVGSHVWISSNYCCDGVDPEIVRVGDGRSNGYDTDGDCVHSVPAEWCTFYSEEQGHAMAQAKEDDAALMGYAVG